MPHMKKEMAVWDFSETESYRVLHITQIICVCVCAIKSCFTPDGDKKTEEMVGDCVPQVTE